MTQDAQARGVCDVVSHGNNVPKRFDARQAAARLQQRRAMAEAVRQKWNVGSRDAVRVQGACSSADDRSVVSEVDGLAGRRDVMKRLL